MFRNDTFKGKVALVTGARSGMGLSAAQRFAELGASVALVGRNEPVDETKELADQGYPVISIKADISVEEDCKRMVEETVRAFGRLDFAFNNAGIMVDACDLDKTPVETFDKIIAINLRGQWMSMKYELAQLVKQEEGGAIVNNSSHGGIMGVAGRSAYSASKFGLNGITKAAAVEYASRNIRINAVCPGTIVTPMVETMVETENISLQDFLSICPMKRNAEPVEVADVVMFLCSENSSFITGECIAVNGGQTAGFSN